MVKFIQLNEPNLESFIALDGKVYDTAHRELSDTALIKELYSLHGMDCVQHMNGSFAFVLYDKEKNQIFGAVDRIGTKTAYYFLENGEFGFGTDLMPLCANHSFTISSYARQCYFSMQYIPAPLSIFEQVNKLRPGEYLLIDGKSGTITTHCYWDLYDNTCQFTKPKTYEEALQNVEKLLYASFDDYLNSEKQPSKRCTFLSGGIDSSLITMYASCYHTNLESFTIGYNELKYDESKYAKQVADYLGVKCNKIIFTPNDAIHVVDGLQKFYDEPMGDASMIPTSFVCEQAAINMNMAYGGDGGDEVFFGYPRYLRYAGYQKLFVFPQIVRNIGAVIANMAHKTRIAKSLKMKDIQELYMNRRPSNAAELFDAIQIQQSIEQCRYLYNQQDIRRCFNDFDIKTLMCHGYNVKLIRAAQRAQLAIYTPFLDYRLVEYSRLLPLEYNYTPQTGQKRLLRDLLSKRIPKEVFERRIQGFGVPIGEWMREGIFKDYLLDVLNKGTVHLLPDYDGERLLAVRDAHIAGNEDQTTLLWLCVNYIAWCQFFQLG